MNMHVTIRDGQRVALPEPLWFAVATRNRSEVEAEVNLRRQGFMTYYPFVRERKRRKIPGSTSYRVQWVEKPYFPGYLFVSIRFDDESLYDVQDTVGVLTVFRPGKRPMYIQPDVMNQLMKLGDKGEMPLPPEQSQWAEGKRFTVAVGHAFAGFVARMSELKNLDKSGTLSAFINVLGGEREVTLPAWAVAEIIG